MQLGFECDTVQNGNQAIELVQQRISAEKDGYDLIVTSHKVRVQDEMWAMKTIRTIMKDVDRRQPYICLLSTDIVTAKLSQKAMKYGIDDVVNMPVFKAAAHKILTEAKLLVKP